MKKIKSILLTALFVGLVLLPNQLLRYMLTDDVKSYTRVMMHELYEQDEIDALFIGSSHCYRSVNPEIADELLAGNTFNAGTSSQTLLDTWYLLQEAGKSADIKSVYVELYFGVRGRDYTARENITSTYLISDYMRPSWRKAVYLLQSSNTDTYANSFIYARRNWESIFNKSYVNSLIESKRSESYKNYSYEPITYENERYTGKGFVYSEEFVESGNFFSEGLGGVREDIFSADRKWLNKIISYCQERDIQLTFFAAPMSDFKVYGTRNYDDYIIQVKQELEGTGIPYYDFNLCREEYLDLSGEDFKDEGHTNGDGAAKFTAVFCSLINGELDEEQLFYESYQDKLNHSPEELYGLVVKEIKDAGKKSTGDDAREWKITPIGNIDAEKLEYRISVLNESGTVLLQDWGDKNTFDNAGKGGEVCIEAREKDTGRVLSTVEFSQ